MPHPLFWVTVTSIILAQLYKVVVESVRERKLKFYRFFETGGMPSSHTAAVTALATGAWKIEGVSSPLFAITLVYGTYFVFEATGLRQEVGKQARLLNDILDELLDTHQLATEKLRELRGHTWAEVFWGFLLGLATTLVFLRS